MSKNNENHEWFESFLSDLEALIEKNAEHTPEVISALQTTVIAMVCDMAPSVEEAADSLHDMIDDYIDDMIAAGELEGSSIEE